MIRPSLTAQDVFDNRDEYVRQRNLIARNFYHPSKPRNEVHLLIADDLTDKHVDAVAFASGPVQVLSKRDLVEMKRQSNRAQDREDVAALERLQ